MLYYHTLKFVECVFNNKIRLFSQSGLTDLGAVSVKFKQVVEFGFSQLSSSVVKPRIRPLVDTFLATNHNLTEVAVHLISIPHI